MRWAAELLSKYVIGDDGKTPYERVYKEDCRTPLAPFGEIVMYFQLRSVHRNKGTPAKRMGVWLGVSERTEEMLIGTRDGVVKYRTVDRFSEVHRWNNDNVLEMDGTSWEPVLGEQSQHIPVDVVGDEECMGSESENVDSKDEKIDDEIAEPVFRGGVDKFHVSKKAIRRCGETPDCVACLTIKNRGDIFGRIGNHHLEDCRKRILENMTGDPEYRHLAKKYKEIVDGKNDQVEVDLGTMMTGDTTQPTTNQCESEHEHKVVNSATSVNTDMCDNVRRAIKQLKETIWKEEENLARQSANNLGTPINYLMVKMLMNQMQVAEVYSPPRVVETANKMGMRGGWSLDLITCDTDGLPWDFNSAKMRNRAIRKLLNDKPIVLIGSPMCTEYSTMNQINHARMGPEVVTQRMTYARKHLEFCIQLYEIQWRNGRYFLHEHPEGVGS